MKPSGHPGCESLLSPCGSLGSRQSPFVVVGIPSCARASSSVAGKFPIVKVTIGGSFLWPKAFAAFRSIPVVGPRRLLLSLCARPFPASNGWLASGVFLVDPSLSLFVFRLSRIFSVIGSNSDLKT